MEHIAAAEEKIVSDRIRRKLDEVNVAAQNQLQPIQDHVNFNLQVSSFQLFIQIKEPPLPESLIFPIWVFALSS